jgi:multidrug transporter EmrE-like cation transporter
LIVFSALAFFKALSTTSFSMIIPIATGVHFILTVCVDYFLFQGKITIHSFAGFILIISGIIVLSLNNHVQVK